MSELQEAIKAWRQIVKRFDEVEKLGDLDKEESWVSIEALRYGLAFLECHTNDAVIQQFQEEVRKAETASFVNTQQIHELDEWAAKSSSIIFGLKFEIGQVDVKIANATGELAKRMIQLEKEISNLHTQLNSLDADTPVNLYSDFTHLKQRVKKLEHKLEGEEVEMEKNEDWRWKSRWFSFKDSLQRKKDLALNNNWNAEAAYCDELLKEMDGFERSAHSS